MMIKRTIVAIVLLIIALTVLSFTAGKGVVLRLKPKQGKTYTVIEKTDMTTTMKTLGQTVKRSQIMEQREVFTIKEVTEENIVIETKLEAQKMTFSMMGRSFTYDSEHPESVSPMINKEQIQQFENDLKQVAILTYDTLGSLIDGNNSLSVYKLGGGISGLPEQELEVGSTWTKTHSNSVNGIDYSVDMNYTVTSITKKILEFSYFGNINSESNMVSGTYEGIYSFDRKTGLLIKETQKQNMNMIVIEQGIRIPTTLVGNTIIKVK